MAIGSRFARFRLYARSRIGAAADSRAPTRRTKSPRPRARSGAAAVVSALRLQVSRRRRLEHGRRAHLGRLRKLRRRCCGGSRRQWRCEWPRVSARPLPPAAAAARRQGGRGGGGADLFGGVAQAGGEDDVMTSAPAGMQQASADAGKLTGQRNENSVLFSLNALAQNAPKDDAPLAPWRTEGSGLDRHPRALSASMGSGETKKSTHVDDIMNLGGGGAFSAALTAPVLAPPTMDGGGGLGGEPRKDNTKILLIGIIGAGALIALAIILVVLMKKPEQVAALPTGAPAATDSVGAGATAPTATAPAATATVANRHGDAARRRHRGRSRRRRRRGGGRRREKTGHHGGGGGGGTVLVVVVVAVARKPQTTRLLPSSPRRPRPRPPAAGGGGGGKSLPDMMRQSVPGGGDGLRRRRSSCGLERTVRPRSRSCRGSRIGQRRGRQEVGRPDGLRAT